MNGTGEDARIARWKLALQRALSEELPMLQTLRARMRQSSVRVTSIEPADAPCIAAVAADGGDSGLRLDPLRLYWTRCGFI